MTYQLRKGGVVALGVFISLLLSTVIFAQTQEGLQIKPAIIEDNVTLGGTSAYSVTVTNVSAADQTFYLSTQDIKGLDDAGKPVFAKQGEQTGYELSSW